MTMATAVTTALAGQSVTLDFSQPKTFWKTTATGDSIRTNNKAGWKTAETTLKHKDGYTVTFKATDDAYFINSKADTALFIGKKAGITIALPKMDFQVGAIDVVFGWNVSTSVRVDMFVGETAFNQAATGEKKGTATFNVPETLQAAGTQYVLKTTNANNLQVSKIIIKEFEAPEVVAPVITPAGATFTKTQQVTITAGEGCAIYYTLDGTDPNDASTLYEAPIELTKSTVVKAIAYNEEDCGSEITTAEFFKGYAHFNFLKDKQNWTIENKNVPEGNEVWTLDAKYGMKASAYWDKQKHASESWIVSPAISLADAENPVVTISHAAGNFTGVSVGDYVSILVKAEGADEWTALKVENWPTSYTYVNSTISLKDYATKNIQLAIRYTSTTDLAGTYETNGIDVIEGEVVEYLHPANTLETAYTTAQAIEIIENPKAILSEEVFVKGVVSRIDNLTEDGSLTYWLDKDAFEVYLGLGLNGAKFESKNDIHNGDTVIVKGTVTKYKTTYESTAGSELVQVKKYKNAVDIIDPTNTPETAYTVGQCIDMLTKGSQVYDLDKAIFLKGVVTKTISHAPSKMAIRFEIRESLTASDSLEVYQALGLENKEIAADPGKNYVKVGDEVIVYAKIQTNVKDEVVTFSTVSGGYIYSRNGQTSALEDIKADDAVEGKEIYNILGQKVDAITTKGIYFINGKKVIIR